MTNESERFEKWLDSDASYTRIARSKYYTAQEQVIGSLAWKAGRADLVESVVKELKDYSEVCLGSGVNDRIGAMDVMKILRQQLDEWQCGQGSLDAMPDNKTEK